MNLKTLAEALGLSQTTVSRALNGYPEVSAATRRRVEEAAAQMGYRPNSRAKGLATGRAMLIGQVIPTSTEHEMSTRSSGISSPAPARTWRGRATTSC